MPRELVWVGGEGSPGARLVVMDTRANNQSINICTSLNEKATYEATYYISSPDPYMSVRDVGSCRTVEELVKKVERFHGVKRPERTGPKPKTKGQG